MRSIIVPPGLPAVTINITFEELSASLGTIAFAYPFDDPNIGLAHNDNGIAEGMLPNRTIKGQIIPGSFYVLRISDAGKVEGLKPDDEKKYLEYFSTPEHFGPGKWKVTSSVEEKEHTTIIKIVSAWMEEI